MGGLDPVKLLFILLAAVIVLGPERLPKAARQLGAAWRQLSQLRLRLEEEVRSAMPDLDLPKIPTLPSGGIAGYLTGMMTAAGTGQAGGATAAAGTAAAGSGAVGTEDLFLDTLTGTPRPGSRVATDTASGESLPRSGWRSSAREATPEHSELPAGWQAIGAPGPGYASGSILSPVPSSAPSGLLSVEASLTFDEPSWN
jgi:sec-independent protein translocase protein TatB